MNVQDQYAFTRTPFSSDPASSHMARVWAETNAQPETSSLDKPDRLLTLQVHGYFITILILSLKFFQSQEMSEMRTGRQKYYNIFSPFYDFFIKAHSGRHADETRKFLVESAGLDDTRQARILDICCGTGSVILAFAAKHSDALAIGYDFSEGMLHKAKQKDTTDRVILVQGDASRLSWADDCFDVVCCSHALYELKGQVRTAALEEMKRVVKPDGRVLIMEHEVPEHPLVKIMFHMRMWMMGATDSREFLEQDLSPYLKLFAGVTPAHTPSGKSKLIICRKK